MPDDGEKRPTSIRRALPAAPTLPSLENNQLDPELRLQTVLAMCRRAYEEYEEACSVADDFGVGSLPRALQGDDDALERAREETRARVRKSYARWFQLQTDARAAESDVRKRKLERPLGVQDQAEYDRIRLELRSEYEGLGPHYELLCDNCASISVKLRRMETSGRDYESSEYIDIHKLYLSYINQLQKYTEAMKTESINRQTQEVAEKILQIFERHFGNSDSPRWKAAVDEIKSAVESVA